MPGTAAVLDAADRSPGIASPGWIVDHLAEQGATKLAMDASTTEKAGKGIGDTRLQAPWPAAAQHIDGETLAYT